MRYSALFVVVISISLAGCLGMIYNPKHTLQVYEGNERPDNETSTLRSGWGGGEIVHFDNRKLRPDNRSWDGFLLLQPTKVEMLPGTHTVTIFYSDWDWNNTRVHREITFISEAGHDYTVRSDKHCPNLWDVALWVEDDTNSQIVAGTGPCED